MTESVYFEWENELSGIIKTEDAASLLDPLAEPANGEDSHYLKIEEPAELEDQKEELPSGVVVANETHVQITKELMQFWTYRPAKGLELQGLLSRIKKSNNVTDTPEWRDVVRHQLQVFSLNHSFWVERLS